MLVNFIIFISVVFIIVLWVYLEEKGIKKHKSFVLKQIESTNTNLNKEYYIKKLNNLRQVNLISLVFEDFKEDVSWESFKEGVIRKYSKVLTVSEINKILEGVYFIGMTEDMVIDSQRRAPDKIEFEVLKTKTKKIFVYGNKSSGDVLTFENGILVRIKDR